MTTPAFDRLWDEPQKPKAKPSGDAFDALWGPEKSHAERLHDEFKTGNLARRMASENATEAAEASDPSGTSWRELLTHPKDIPEAGARSMLATQANLIGGLKPARAVAAFLRSKWHGQTYQEALSDIDAETGKIPETMRRVTSGVAAAPAALALPTATLPQAIASSVAFGGASELGDPDPSVGAEERAGNATKAELIGGGLTTAIGGAASVIPKVAKTVSLARRVKNAPTLGGAATKYEKDIAAATTENYGTARAEAEAGGGTSPAVQKALQRPRVAKYAAQLLDDGEAPQSDYEVAHAVAKRISKIRRGLQTKLAKDYDEAVEEDFLRLGRDLKAIRSAIGSPSQKPAITMDIAGETHSVDPRITPGREAMSGPVESAPLASRTTAPSDPTLRQALRDFPESSLPPKMQGPSGPAFQLRGQPDKVTPGVDVETPGMRITTAPAEDVPALSPSYNPAVAEKARMEGERGLFNDASDAGKRIMRGTSLAGKDLRGKSPEAWREMIAERVAKGELSKSEAQAAIKAFLGRAKEEAALKFSSLETAIGSGLLSAGGAAVGGPAGFAGGIAGGVIASGAKAAAQSATRLNRIAPFIEQLDRAAGQGAAAPKIDARQVREMMPALSAQLAKQIVEYLTRAKQLPTQP